MLSTSYDQERENGLELNLFDLEKTRVLSPEDRPAVERLIQDHVHSLQLQGKSAEIFFDFLDQYLDTSNIRNKIFGYFLEETLAATMGIHLWSAMPYATLSYMILKNSRDNLYKNKKYLIYCFHRCLEYGSTKEIKAYYSMQKHRGIRHKEKIWRQNDTPLTKKYYSIREFIVPAQQKPLHFIIYELMDKRTWPHDVDIWCTRLKPQYEPMINWGDK